ncbi:protein ALP1-like [Panicum virgatum]|uniref:protein ALP1-like n=1 Tax=Panicum virgatum TaxID=38727 RepID=UPI0019D4FE3D|nr:protein ALP1-like [Panicum virgatum]
MEDKNLLLKYLDVAYDSDEEMDMELDEMEEVMSVMFVMEEEQHMIPRAPQLPSDVVCRNFKEGHDRIWAHYFTPNPVFRMARHVFNRIVDAVKLVDKEFVQRHDCTGLMGLSSLQKCVASIRILAYGLPADAVDEYIQIGDSTALKAMRHFCRAIIKAFGATYLRAPNQQDIARLLAEGESRGFPGMLGSIDCMHWEWRNCPTAWKGQFTGRYKKPSMILEAVADHKLWFWHAYFGMPGSCNDINVVHRSPLFSRYMEGQTAPVNFNVNGRAYDTGYYLADGIYPDWIAFVKSVRQPMERKTQHFAAQQESARKDIERAFGVLQARWAVVRGPAYGWDKRAIGEIMKACIIMHNMIVEDEGDGAMNTNFDSLGDLADLRTGILAQRDAFVRAHHKLRNREVHGQLQVDLIEHQWTRLGARLSSNGATM